MHIFASILFIVFGTIACQATPIPTPVPTPALTPVVEPPAVAEPRPETAEDAESPADVVLGQAEQQRDAVQAVSATVAVERIEPLFDKHTAIVHHCINACLEEGDSWNRLRVCILML